MIRERRAAPRCRILGGSRWRSLSVLCLLSLSAVSCEAETTRVRHAFVLSELEISLELREEGIVALDLDGFSSDGTEGSFDLDACPHSDLVGVGGETGVDGQLARLGGVIALFGFGDINSTLQQTINEGALILLVELEGEDDLFVPGATFTARAMRGEGPLELGTDGRAEPGQSFDVLSGPSIVGAGTSDGSELSATLEGELLIPIRFAMTRGEVRVRDVQLRVREVAPGVLEGAMGGVVDVGDIERLVIQAVEDGGGTGGPSFLSILSRTLTANADADRDPETGRCAGMTAGFGVRAASAFLLDRAAAE